MKSISENKQTLKLNQNGFIPMMVCILIIIGAIIYFAYSRVAQAGH